MNLEREMIEKFLGGDRVYIKDILSWNDYDIKEIMKITAEVKRQVESAMTEIIITFDDPIKNKMKAKL